MKKKTNREIGQRMYCEVYRIFGTATKAAKAMGSDYGSVLKWAQGVAPSAMFLAKLLKYGGDVIYILTGERSEKREN